MRELPEHYRLQFERCFRIAVKREAIRPIEKHLEQDELQRMYELKGKP